MFNRAGARLRDARPGSVLILVVALLVLMVLVGTAFISTARVERYSATQNTYNTQIDLLVQGLLGMTQAPMVRKVQGSTGFRQAVSAAGQPSAAAVPPALPLTGNFYNPWESPITDLYLADRTPTLINNVPGWGNITAPLNASPMLPTGQFEAPYAIDSIGNAVIGPVTYSQRANLVPSSISITQSDGSVRVYPAFAGITPLQLAKDLPTVSPTGQSGTAVFPLTVLAADTDGDGIADAGFMRLSAGQIEGATYYGAVRVIDNLAAVNASVAMEPFNVNSTPQMTQYAVPGDFFPTNINLRDMVAATGDSLAGLNAYRFGTAGWSTPVADPLPATAASPAVPPTARADFIFNTPYEAAWTQLGSRLNNPGYLTTTTKYQAVPIGEGMNLAYHGGLANINVPAPSPVLESNLPNSLYSASARHGPFSPGDTVNWYNTLYDYSSPNTPLRNLLVVRNPLTSFCPNWFTYAPAVSGTTNYAFGTSVQYADPNTATQMMASGYPRGFVSVDVAADGDIFTHRQTPELPMIGNTYNTFFWAAMPWSNAPTKINANTATFEQLWLAYWSLMQDTPDANGRYPAGSVVGPAPNNQFRNVLRDVVWGNGNTGFYGLSRNQMMQLRAALAAVNTIDMRDGDGDITSRTIALQNLPGPFQDSPFENSPAYAKVYGAEKQPYITEVLIHFQPNGGDPYVAIELYNPHPTPIIANNWKLAYVTHVYFSSSNSGVSSGEIQLTEVCDFTTTFQKAGRAIPYRINPGERIVLQSNRNFVPPNIAASFGARTPPLKPMMAWSTTGTNPSPSSLGVGGELVLLRPRRADGTLTRCSAPNNTYNEIGNLYDLVPLDNIDLTGIQWNSEQPAPAPGMTSPAPQRYRYARATKITSGTDSAAWHCVYPGPYDPTRPGGRTGLFPHFGLIPVLAEDIPPNTPGFPNGVKADNGYLGLPKGKYIGTPTPTSGAAYSPYATYETRPLQINNRDYAGPNCPYVEQANPPNGNVGPATGAPMNLPLGGFARNGDLLQVPFIGAYVVMLSPGSNGFVEGLVMNSVTMDSVYAQFQPPNYNVPLPNSYDADNTLTASDGTPLPAFHNEQIGHLCPMSVGSTDFMDDPAEPPAVFAKNVSGWTYHWAKRLFDYVDVRTPQDAYLPNVDPAVTSAGVSGDPTLAGSQAKYPATTPPVPVSADPNVTPVHSSGMYGYQQLQGRLDTASTEGLININTANWKVLSAVPWYTPGEDPRNYLADNAALAQAITAWRDQNNPANPAAPHTDYGPFRSIFDLMKVPQFATSGGNFNCFWVTSAGSPGEVTNRFGDLSPFAPAMSGLNLSAIGPAYTPNETDLTDHVYGDVKTRFLGLMRISNLITTRSDSFTVYVQVQGWQGVGTTVPTLAATRRAAAFVDRSQVVPLRNATTGAVALTPMGVTNIPND